MKDLIRRIEQLRSTAQRLFLQARLAVMVMGVIGFVCVVALLDFMFRLPDIFRMTLLSAGLIALGLVIYRSIVPALRFRPSLIQMALRVEEKNPSVQGRLASGVEFSLSADSPDGAPLGPLARRTVADLEHRASAISFKGLLDARFANQMLTATLVIITLLVMFSIWRPTESSIAARRVLLPFTSAKWPARTLVQSGMDPQLVHPRGEPLIFAARLSKGDPARDAVFIRYRFEREGVTENWQELRMTRQSGDQFERVIDTEADGIEYTFFTSEDETDLRAVRIIPAPAVLSTSATITPPAYAADRGVLTTNMGNGTDRRSRFEGPILEGSRAEIEIELNRPLPVPEEDTRAFINEVITVPGEGGDFEFTMDSQSPERWRVSFQLDQSGEMSLSLRDENGLENLDPIRYRFDTIEDRSPTITISRPVADESVSANARVPVVVEARDDVSLASVLLETTLRNKGEDSRVDVRDDLDHGEATEEMIRTSTTASVDLDLSEMDLVGGDEVVLVAIATDSYEVDGVRHNPVRSSPRRLVVVSDAEVAEQLRSSLAGIRRSAIRLEGEQRDLQDGIRSRGADEGMRRSQARLGDRLATAAESLEAISRRREQNQLDTPMLEEVLRQSQDIIEAAQRASAEAVDAIERAVSEQAFEDRNRSGSPGRSQSGSQGEPQSGSQGESQSGSEGEPQSGSQGESQSGSEGEPRSGSQGESQSGSEGERQSGSQGESQSGSQSGSQSDSQSESQSGSQGGSQSGSEPNQQENRDQTESEQAALDAQENVRAELTDLASLLDRDEDAWVVTRRVQQMQERLQDMIERTEELGEETIGRERSELSDAEREAIDRLAAEQASEQEEAQELIEELEQRAEALQRADPTQAAGLRQAAQRARQGQLDQQMEEASEASRNNRLQQAQEAQEQAAETLEGMMDSIEESRKARVEDIRRRIASLVESIEGLIATSEDELIALARMADDPEAASIATRAREMMRLNTNTMSVAAEARAAGNEGSRIARSVDRAARSQGAAIGNLRSDPVDLDEARDDEERALASLKEALDAAQEQAERMAEQQAEEQRKELLSFYSELLDRQSQVKIETEGILPDEGQRLGRRGLVTSRRMAIEQNQIGERLTNLKDEFQEITDSLVFSMTHRNLDTWSEEIARRLQDGVIDVETIEYETMMLDALGGLMQALDQEPNREDPFEQPENQQAGGQGQGQEGGQPQPLIPPIAELKALKSLQQQILDATIRMDARRSKMDPDALSRRLEQLGEMQSDLHAVGTALIQQLQSSEGPNPIEPGESKPENQDPAN